MGLIYSVPEGASGEYRAHCTMGSLPCGNLVMECGDADVPERKQRRDHLPRLVTSPLLSDETPKRPAQLASLIGGLLILVGSPHPDVVG